MAELAARGYNVAKVEVDGTDDVIAFDEDNAGLVRIQVKTSIARSGMTPRGRIQYEFTAHVPGFMSDRPDSDEDLFFVFVMILPRDPKRWAFVILPRARLTRFVRGEGVGTARANIRSAAHLFIEHAEATDTTSFLSRGTGQRVYLEGFADNWDDFFPPTWHTSENLAD